MRCGFQNGGWGPYPVKATGARSQFAGFFGGAVRSLRSFLRKVFQPEDTRLNAHEPKSVVASWAIILSQRLANICPPTERDPWSSSRFGICEPEWVAGMTVHASDHCPKCDHSAA